MFRTKACIEIMPPIHRCHRVRKQVAPRFFLKPMVYLSFDSVLGITMRPRTVCFRSSSQHIPAILMDDF